MKVFHNLTLIIVTLLVFSGCEIEKTEYLNISNDKYFEGFSSSIFIMHKNSFSYYSIDENKVFNDLYFHQNGFPIKNGINSFLSDHEQAVISYEKDNLIEFLEKKNFTSDGYIEINHPRNIIFIGWPNLLVSFGELKNGGIAVLNKNSRQIIKTIPLSIEPGKIYSTEGYYNYYAYILSSGNNYNDSMIYRLYQSDYNPQTLHKLDSIIVGIRPVDCAPYNFQYNGYSHQSLAILCLGNEHVPPSVKILDVILNKIVASYEFESSIYQPHNLFQLYRDNAEYLLLSNINNKLYSISLANPIEMSLVIDKNIVELNTIGSYYMAVSRDTLQSKSSLYRFDRNTLELKDSLIIEGKALKLVQ